MATELRYSDDVNPAFFEAMGDDQMVCATAVIKLGFDQKTLIAKARQSGEGLLPLDEAKVVAVEMFKDVVALRAVLGAQNPIANAHGVILHSNLGEITFVIGKANLMREVVGHPGIRAVTIESIGAPNVMPRSTMQQRTSEPAGVVLS